tara:strand:+ start:345 stop:620 length:276 start_codon:yes stop_codon:yes gene_type:complete
MNIVKEIKNDRIEIVGKYRQLQIREKILILENGEEISSSYHRYMLSPGDDLSNQTDEIKKICESVWTDEIKKAFQLELNKDIEKIEKLMAQ